MVPPWLHPDSGFFKENCQGTPLPSHSEQSAPSKALLDANEYKIIHNGADCEMPIQVASWNIRGMSDKLSDPDLQELIFHNEIIILYETMKGATFDIAIPGYTFFHYARKPEKCAP